MSRADPEMALEHDSSRECIGCGTAIPLNEAILLKFHRCYYCGQHHPFGSEWKTRTAPVLIAAMIGLIALWWTQLGS
jgi:hypothetical protein